MIPNAVSVQQPANASGPNSSRSFNAGSNSTFTSVTSMFEYKLLNYYFINKIGIPFIPFAFELQQVFHSIDFSRLLNLLGIVTSNNCFPYLPISWIETNSTELAACVSLVEKCLGLWSFYYLSIFSELKKKTFMISILYNSICDLIR